MLYKLLMFFKDVSDNIQLGETFADAVNRNLSKCNMDQLQQLKQAALFFAQTCEKHQEAKWSKPDNGGQN